MCVLFVLMEVPGQIENMIWMECESLPRLVSTLSGLVSRLDVFRLLPSCFLAILLAWFLGHLVSTSFNLEVLPRWPFVWQRLGSLLSVFFFYPSLTKIGRERERDARQDGIWLSAEHESLEPHVTGRGGETAGFRAGGGGTATPEVCFQKWCS